MLKRWVSLQKNINKLTYNDTTPAEARFIGKEGKFGEELGLANDWAYQIVKQVGNYGESYEKHLGLDTPLLLARGANALWTKGGILYAPPIR
jgi:general L-amino acid transport system substrate-binding protein